MSICPVAFVTVDWGLFIFSARILSNQDQLQAITSLQVARPRLISDMHPRQPRTHNHAGVDASWVVVVRLVPSRRTCKIETQQGQDRFYSTVFCHVRTRILVVYTQRLYVYSDV